jgi:hypothetical protein
MSTLIGTAPDQVPVNGMLGDMAFQSKASVTVGDIRVCGTLRMQGYTVATLPTVGIAGRRAYVTNALSPTFGSTVVTGGAVVIPVFDNGTNWIVG